MINLTFMHAFICLCPVHNKHLNAEIVVIKFKFQLFCQLQLSYIFKKRKIHLFLPTFSSIFVSMLPVCVCIFFYVLLYIPVTCVCICLFPVFVLPCSMLFCISWFLVILYPYSMRPCGGWLELSLAIILIFCC